MLFNNFDYKMNTLVKTILLIFIFWFIPICSHALTISPPTIEIEVDPGETITQTVKAWNETNETLKLFLSIEKFRARGEDGQAEFFSPKEEKYIFYDWINFKKEPIVLKSQERAEVSFVIKVPKQAPPGGYYTAIFWASSPPNIEDKTAIGVVSKTGTLVLLKVRGEINEQCSLLEFDTLNKKRFFSSLPIDFFVRIENLGNVHLKPEGKIKIINHFNKLEATLDVNSKKGNILPQSIRRFEVFWNAKKTKNSLLKSNKKFFQNFYQELKNEKNNFTIGRYSVYLNLNYGQAGRIMRGGINFWIIPWRIILLSLPSLIILILLLKFGIKKYNKWLINKYKIKIS